MTGYQMNEEQYEVLLSKWDTGDHGPDAAFLCNVNAEDHLHVQRIGDIGDGTVGRVALMCHDTEDAKSVFVAAAEARMIASALLDAADELDGATPLVFFPRSVEQGPNQAPGDEG